MTPERELMMEMFVKKVNAMRQAQRAFFKTRKVTFSGDNMVEKAKSLLASKTFEQEVDEMLDALVAKQLPLFPPVPEEERNPDGEPRNDVRGSDGEQPAGVPAGAAGVPGLHESEGPTGRDGQVRPPVPDGGEGPL